jgi:glycosyltransferase involved in cell wall biosynthesis
MNSSLIDPKGCIHFMTLGVYVNKKVFINMANIHSGGGLQVATSFICELVNIEISDFDLYIFLSSEVNAELARLDVKVEDFSHAYVENNYGLGAFNSSLNDKVKGFDLGFTVFGPNYLRSKDYINLVGFAQPWILDGSVYNILPTLSRFKSKLKFAAQKWFFKRSDALVVELEHVRDGLCQRKIAAPADIYVAYNCISSLYFNKSFWRSVDILPKKSKFRIGFLSRDYPHKNTKIIPSINRVLREKYGLDVEFWVTLNGSEWANKSEEFKQRTRNAGSLSVAQCPSFYQAMDAVIFPSLLECFSATPLEAIVMERPLFASDRRFVRDVCGNYAIYFDPLDALDAARVIADYIRHHHGKDGQRLTEAREHAVNFSNARGRAERYLEIIRSLLAEKGQKA